MEYELVRSKRKTLTIEITPDGVVLVKAPLRMMKSQIDHFLYLRRDWIEANQKKVLEREARLGPVDRLSEEDLKALKKKAREIILPLVEDYAEIMGVIYGRVAIRAQKSRWGSCSRDGNLNFNCLLALCPEGAQRYVVVHELCHRRHMDHSRAFWLEVEEYMPDYREWRRWLKTDGSRLIRML